MAKTQKPYTREQTAFVTPVGIGTFLRLEPGDAREITSTDANTAGGYSYKAEFIADSIPTQGTEQETSLFRAVQTVAWYEDQANYTVHLFGRDGAFKKLEEIHGRRNSLASYPYAAGKHVLNISTTYYPDMAQMHMPKNFDLANPEHRKLYDEAVAAKAPGVVRFMQPSNPADVARFRESNDRLRLLGSPTIPDADMYKQTVRLQPHEYWSGCYFQVSGEAYWSKRHKNVALSVGHVLFIRGGERLGGGAQKSPDQVFTPQMPDPSLAPPPALPTFQASPPPPVFAPPQAPPGWAM